MKELELIIDKVFKEVIELYKPFDFEPDGIKFNKQDLQISISLNEFHKRIATPIEQYIIQKIDDYIKENGENGTSFNLRYKVFGTKEEKAELKKGIK